MNKFVLTILFFTSCIGVTVAQAFMPKIEDADASQLFNLPAVVTLNDGSKVVGNVLDLYLAKGHLTNVSLKLQDGTTQKYKPNEIESLSVRCLKPDVFSLLDSASNVIKKVITTQFVFDHPFRTEKKVKSEMMQLLNPGFSSAIKVYADPGANETRSISIKGVPLPGEGVEAYIIVKGNAVFYVKESSYERVFDNLFNDCKKVYKEIELAYERLPGYILLYDHYCGSKK
jgi:hypothetical protein